ncbi:MULTISPECIES: hypothetical protein [Streptomyces]|uniref:hypothetical protein n=1 Tax=Streptomyces TaxID=1883 RepID=UPI0013311FAA|nr:hypothetical protein [Streptomyces sp. Ag109_G2-6]
MTATDVAAMTAVAVSGATYRATAPARAAPTPCRVSLPVECRPSASPRHDLGLRFGLNGAAVPGGPNLYPDTARAEDSSVSEPAFCAPDRHI